MLSACHINSNIHILFFPVQEVPNFKSQLVIPKVCNTTKKLGLGTSLEDPAIMSRPKNHLWFQYSLARLKMWCPWSLALPSRRQYICQWLPLCEVDLPVRNQPGLIHLRAYKRKKFWWKVRASLAAFFNKNSGTSNWCVSSVRLLWPVYFIWITARIHTEFHGFI